MSKHDYQKKDIAGLVVETWYDPTYIDPSDLHVIELGASGAIMRPYLLVVDGNRQAFALEEKRNTYLKWRIKLAQQKGL